MLELRGLHTHYGTSHIVQGIDLDACAGEVIGVFGRNGVGKTTLIKTIAGWLKPTAGEICVDGVRIDGRSPHAVCHAGVSLVPEDRRIFPGLTVDENLSLGCLQLPNGRRSSRAAVARIYKRFPRLGERQRQLGTTLSGGEQQMLAMARVMLGRSKVLLIDEPSEGLAPMIVADIYAIIGEMRASGTTILLVEQNLHQALTICDRFVAIDRGRVVLNGNGRDPEDKIALMKAVAV